MGTYKIKWTIILFFAFIFNVLVMLYAGLKLDIGMIKAVALVVLAADILFSVFSVLYMTAGLGEIEKAAGRLAQRNYEQPIENPEKGQFSTIAREVNDIGIILQKNKEYIDSLVNRNPVTGIRNEEAYKNYVQSMKRKMSEWNLSEFGVAIFEVVDENKILNTNGQDLYNRYVNNICSTVCKVFVHSPVFHIENDRFVAILLGQDYEQREQLLSDFRQQMKRSWNLERVERKIIVASGMSVFSLTTDRGVNETFSRAKASLSYNKRVVQREFDFYAPKNSKTEKQAEAMQTNEEV